MKDLTNPTPYPHSSISGEYRFNLSTAPSSLIIGGSGLLGTYLQKCLERATCPTSLELDIGSYFSIKKYFTQNKFDYIYIAAAYTDVDGCQKNTDKSFDINCKAISYISEFSKAKIIKKLNFPYRLINALQNKEEVTVASNQFGTPTYAADLAQHSMILAPDKTGVYHISSSADIIAKNIWANLIASKFGLDFGLIRSIEVDNKYRPEKAGVKSEFEVSLSVALDDFKKEF